MDPKAHEITATRRDYLSEAKRVTVAAGQVQDIEIKLVTLDEAADAGRPWAKWKPWAVVAAGLVVAGGSAAVHAVSAHDFKRFDDDFVTLGCSTTGCTTAELGPSRVQRLSHGALLQDIAVGGYITGGVLFTAGVALLYFNRPRLVEQRVTTARTNHLDITPTVSGDAIGVVLTMDR
jgi:hypothetical protein